MNGVGIGLKVFYNAFLSLIECNIYSKTLHSRTKGLINGIKNEHCYNIFFVYYNFCLLLVSDNKIKTTTKRL